VIIIVVILVISIKLMLLDSKVKDIGKDLDDFKNYTLTRLNDITIRISTIEISMIMLEESVSVLFKRIGKIDEDLVIIRENVKFVDKKIDDVHVTFDTFYNASLVNYPIIREVEISVKTIWDKLAGAPLTRQALGLGCWPAGTRIQLNKSGKTILVEDVNSNTFIWNPVLNEEIEVRTPLPSPENGFLWKFTTNDSLSVRVTETHAMRVYDSIGWKNVAAKNVVKGDYMETINGVSQVVMIEKIPVSNVPVYNFLYKTAPEDIPVHQRVVISDGIYTLDLHAQEEHHNDPKFYYNIN